MNNVLYVYGTLRPGETAPVKIPGRMYDLGSYPGVEVLSPECDSHFFAERIEVNDAKLIRLDMYEGFRPDRPESSLFRRVPYLDGQIYVYNHSFEGRPLVESGDWLVHREARRGGASNLLDTPKVEEDEDEEDYAGAA